MELQMDKIECAIVSSIFLFCTAGCNGESSPEEIAKAFEDSLGIDIPSNYRVVKNRTSLFISYSKSYSASYRIQFDPAVFEEFVQQLDMKKWRSDYEGVYDFIEPERNGVTIQMVPESRRLSYFYSR